MTEDAIRSLINSYIVDNQSYSITPAKMRDMMQQTVDFIIDAVAGGGGGTTPDLQAVTTEGAVTTDPITVGTITDGFTISDDEIKLTSGGTGIFSMSNGSGEFVFGFKHSTTAFNYILKQSLTAIAADVTIRMPNSSGTMMRKEDLSLQLLLTTSNTASGSLNMVFGTNPSAGITTYDHLGVSGAVSSVQRFFAGLSGGIGQIFLKNTGTYGTWIKGGFPSGADNILTLPTVTDIIATKGDVGQRYRLTVTSTGASSYTFTIPLLPFTPIVMVCSAGGPWGPIYGNPISTTSVNVGFTTGPYPVAGVPLVFHVVIYG